MLFNSLTFVIFLIIVLCFYYIINSWHYRKFLLLVSSYLFYAAWNPPFVVLLWISTLTDWFVVKGIGKTFELQKRRMLLAASLVINLGLLGFFKYGTFILDNFVSLVNLAGFNYHPATPNIILPIGISFYTFQTLSYTFDVYRGKAKPWHSFLDYAMYVTFFPQLVAGPIVRAFDFLPQCTRPKNISVNNIGWGMAFITLGLFQKIVIADGILAPVADAVYQDTTGLSASVAWTGTLAFAGQIFCDFSGYSTCAIGIARCLGFELPVNFRFPYAAIGFSDFWRRWHISLSSWLRDYLYISLGGNRQGYLKTQFNLMVTMLIGGLWHGASWTFVLWGGLHGLYLIIEKILVKYFGKYGFWRLGVVQIFLALATFLLVCITWVFFRADSFNSAFNMLGAMFTGGINLIDMPYQQSDGFLALIVVVVIVFMHRLMREKMLETFFIKLPSQVVAMILGGMLYLTLTSGGNDKAFIYFQF